MILNGLGITSDFKYSAHVRMHPLLLKHNNDTVIILNKSIDEKYSNRVKQAE